MSQKVWSQPNIINWTQILLDNFERLLGYSLIERWGDKKEQAKALFFQDFVVVSHDSQENPILNYGNQKALDLWVMDWKKFTRTPSRLTAEAMDRTERAAMLEQVNNKGYIDNYNSVRIASDGQKFYIKQTIIWNLIDNSGNKCGQAATFKKWQKID